MDAHPHVERRDAVEGEEDRSRGLAVSHVARRMRVVARITVRARAEVGATAPSGTHWERLIECAAIQDLQLGIGRHLRFPRVSHLDAFVDSALRSVEVVERHVRALECKRRTCGAVHEREPQLDRRTRAPAIARGGEVDLAKRPASWPHPHAVDARPPRAVA